MICKGCGSDRKLIKAHIIPESFFVGLRDGKSPPQLITDIQGIYPKKSPIGIYDKEILCSSCESKFQAVDDYAQKLLLKNECEHIELKRENKVVGYKIEGVDHHLLKMFCLSVLWRASISSHEFYSKVDLGPFESEVKDLIWSDNSGGESQFSFIISKFTDKKIGRTMLDPHRERWQGVNYYRFYMYGYVVYIKVDKRKTPSAFESFELLEDGTLFVVGRDIHNSQEFPVLTSVAKEARS